MNNNKYIECPTLERFNEVTTKIVAFEDVRTGGEYSRTETNQIYPEPLEDAYPFYFTIELKWFELFEENEMLDELPELPEESEEDESFF